MADKNRTQTMDYDVIIVGAGPAGAAAAKGLVQQGYRVVIVERKILPRHKTCSGMIADRAQDLIEEHFGPLPENVLCAPHRIKGFKICMAGNTVTDVPLKKSFVQHVRRSAFDFWLVRQSRAKVLDGCHLLNFEQEQERVTATVVNSNGEKFRIRAAYLIGADGGRSFVRRLLKPSGIGAIGWYTFIQLYCTARIDLDQDYYYLLFNPALTSIYTWLHAEDDKLVFGVGQPMGGSIEPCLQNTKAYLTENFGLNIQRIERRTGGIATNMGMQGNFFLGRGRVLLAGEAAGFLNLFGEGISSALATGYLAAEAVHAAAKTSGAALDLYAEMTREERRMTTKSWELGRMLLGQNFMEKQTRTKAA